MYEQALELAERETRQEVLGRIEKVKERIRTEEAVAAAEHKAEKGEWRDVWERVNEAKGAGIEDPRLDEFTRRAMAALTPPAELKGALGMEFVLIPDGSFRMGSGEGRSGERPVHDVTLSCFYIGRYEVTQAQFEAYRRGLRSVRDTASDAALTPAVSVSWNDTAALCKYLSSIDGSGAVYRLPTEAEWEYAARGPEGRRYPWGNARPSPEQANVAGEADGWADLAPVGRFPGGSTPLGVLDLAGNAAEWCADWYGRYPDSPETDPGGPVNGRARVVRGGAFLLDESFVRAAARSGRRPDNGGDFIGFRVARELTADEAEFHRKARGRHD